jgi:hypothetical protein
MQRKWQRRRGWLAIALATTVTGVVPAEKNAPVAASPSVVLEQTFLPPLENGWARVERYLDQSSGFIAESYPPDGRGDQTAQSLTYFGSPQPFSGRFTLHYAPGWQTGSKPTPVLLVTGAAATADFPFADPSEGGPIGCGDFPCPSTGLMQYLDVRGYKVFAIGFPHKNGDNYYWSEQIYDAIQIIKQRTGATEVDVVAISKGATAARMYVSSFRKPWGTAYAGDVRRLVQIGGANRGFDWPFRHGAHNIQFVYPECGGTLNAPAPVTAYTCFGVKFSHPELGFASGNFPGSGQVIARWDSTYPRPWWELGANTVWHGGSDFLIDAPGIQEIIDSQSIIQPLIDAGVPASVEVYQLCGSAATLPLLHNEHTGPSDGALFVASCRATDGIANRVAATTLFWNHLELAWRSTAMSQVENWLR